MSKNMSKKNLFNILSFLKTDALGVDIALAVATALTSFFYWRDFFEKNENWRWFGGVIIGLIAIIKTIDVIDDLRKRRARHSNRIGI
jgi:hypothetical protein